MNLRPAWLVGAVIVTGAAQANMILNGDFESNTAGSTQYNLSNASFTGFMANTTGYGSANELDIMTFGSYDLPPQSGSWKVGLANGLGTDAFSFDLSSGITNGTSYTLSFWAHRDTAFRTGTGPVDIGISTSNSSFGTQVYSTGTGIPGTAWQQYTTSFTASMNASYLTVQVAPGADISWIHVDNFSLDVVPEPASMAALGMGALAVFARKRKK